MPAIALILGLISLGMLCRALFALAVHALPFFVCISIAFAMLHAGCDVGSAVLAGVVAVPLTAVTSRLLFAFAPFPMLRLIVAAGFLVPAAIAGYHVVFGLAGFAIASSFGRAVAACVGASLVGAMAWQKLAPFDGPGSSPIHAEPPVGSPHSSRPRGH